MRQAGPPMGIVRLLLCAALACAACLVAQETSTNRATEYFPADGFQRGFAVTPPRIARQIPLADFGRLAPMDPTQKQPFWTVVQWHCLESLDDAHRTTFGPREAAWENPFQKLRVLVDPGGHAALRMTIDSLAIYNRNPIPYTSMCSIRPHLLLSHNFYPDLDGVRRFGGAEEADTTPDGSTFPELNSFATLALSMRLRLVEATDMCQAYGGDKPTSRRDHYNRVPFQFWFRVYCRNPKDPAYGRFFWLGCRVYNSDYPHTHRIGRERDQIESDGKATYAYRLSDLSIHGPDYDAKVNQLSAGKETPIEMDVLGAARKALRAIQKEKQDFLAAPADLSGYTIISFNIGWEPAAPFRGTMSIRGLSLRGVEK